MRIVLCCAAGMSTSMLVNKMQHAAQARGLAINIQAVRWPISNVSCRTQTWCCSARRCSLKLPASPPSRPQAAVAVIDMMDYGMMRGEQVLDKALALHAS